MIAFCCSVHTVDNAARHTEGHLGAFQFVETVFELETVFGRSFDNPFVLAFKEYGTSFDIGANLTIFEQVLTALSVCNPFKWVPGKLPVLPIDAKDRNLV